MKKVLISISMLLATTFAYADDYIIDAKDAHASINFKIQHLGYSWLAGRFNDFEGKFTFDDKDITKSSVSVTINTESLDSNHSERDKHIRSDDFLSARKFPQATFVSHSVSQKGEELIISGDFTLKGITKPLQIVATKIGEGIDPWGGYRAGFSGETSFALSDFGIMTDLGPASKDVYLTLHIEGVKQ